MERRTFLKSGLALAGASLVPGIAGAELPARTASRLDALGSRLRGKVVLPESPDYAILSQLWNARYAEVLPAAIVVAADEGDVAAGRRLRPRRGAGLRHAERRPQLRRFLHDAGNRDRCPGIDQGRRRSKASDGARRGGHDQPPPLRGALAIPHGGPGRDVSDGGRGRACARRRVRAPLADPWADQRSICSGCAWLAPTGGSWSSTRTRTRISSGRTAAAAAAISAWSPNSPSGCSRWTCRSPMSTTPSPGRRR